VWRVPGSKDPKGMALFGRLIGAPAEQNLVGLYADGGMTLSGMIPRRYDDTLAVGFAYTRISNDVQDPE
jgi:porin